MIFMKKGLAEAHMTQQKIVYKKNPSIYWNFFSIYENLFLYSIIISFFLYKVVIYY